MSYKEQLFKKLQQFLDESVIEYSIIPLEETSFHPRAFIDFVQDKVENFSYFPMEEGRYTLKMKRYIHTLFRRKHPNKPLYLILFLHGSPQDQKVIRLNHAYDIYSIFNNILISDWAIADSRFQFIIYADDIMQKFVLSQKAHSEALIYVSVNHKFPPHETVN